MLLPAGVVLRNQLNEMFAREGAVLFRALNGALLGAGLRRKEAAN
jgi:hypothetical protein